MKKYEAVAEEETPNEELVGIPAVEEEDSKQGFPPESLQPLRGLLYLGALNKNFTYAGHEFLISTMTEGEFLRVGQLMSEYKGTFSESEARKTFTVAACVQAVDGLPIVTDIKPMGDVAELKQKADEVMRWYPPVVDYVFRRYMELESTEVAVANALKK